MAKTHDVVAVTGKYTDKNGKEKSRYQTIGAIIQTKNGPMLKLESVPLGWDGWAYMNEPDAKEPRNAKAEKDDSGVPF
jgi:hypothetical protein